MHWIFLSPHPDDVALSCGGLISEMLVHGHTAEVWTICCGDIPPGRLTPVAKELHTQWGFSRNAPALRREEDRKSLAVLGIPVTQFAIPDCIYRRDLITGKPLIKIMSDLFAPFPASEESRVDDLSVLMKGMLSEFAQLVSPYGYGNHLDHILVRKAAEKLTGSQTWYYADYPYTLLGGEQESPETTETLTFPIGNEALVKWQQSIAEHQSQISTFWGSVDEMKRRIKQYRNKGGGDRIWRLKS